MNPVPRPNTSPGTDSFHHYLICVSINKLHIMLPLRFPNHIHGNGKVMGVYHFFLEFSSCPFFESIFNKELVAVLPIVTVL